MTNIDSIARSPLTPLFGKYVALHATLSRLGYASDVRYLDAAAHVLAASVASEDGDSVGIRANLSQAFALVADATFTVGAA